MNILGLVLFSFGFGSNPYNELHNTLLSNYNNNNLPVTSPKPINLSLGMALRAINSIDQIDGMITTNVWLRHFWNDEQLIWNPEDYNNITEIALETDPSSETSIWVPDIYLYNTGEKPLENLDYSRANVYSNGNVAWSRPGLITATCVFDLEKFPYDVQNCTLKFGSWVYYKSLLNLSAYETSIDMSNYQENDGWEIMRYWSEYSEQVYACCPQVYPDMKYHFTIRRKAGFYNINIIGPTFATAVLMVISLLIPWDSGERISFAITVMLSIIVFLLILSDNLPKTDTIPLLSKMLVGLTAFSLIMVFFTVIITAMHSYEPSDDGWLVKLANKICELNCKRREVVDRIMYRTHSYSAAINRCEESEPRQCIVDSEDCKKYAKKIEHWFTVIFILCFGIYSAIMFAEVPSV